MNLFDQIKAALTDEGEQVDVPDTADQADGDSLGAEDQGAVDVADATLTTEA